MNMVVMDVQEIVSFKQRFSVYFVSSSFGTCLFVVSFSPIFLFGY